MSHGVRILASISIPRGHISQLNLSRCGMDATALSVLLNSMLQKQIVTLLDVSDQAMSGGMPDLANFLRVDKKLQVLRARGINLNAGEREFLELTKAIDMNVTLAELDLRGNYIPTV